MKIPCKRCLAMDKVFTDDPDFFNPNFCEADKVTIIDTEKDWYAENVKDVNGKTWSMACDLCCDDIRFDIDFIRSEGSVAEYNGWV